MQRTPSVARSFASSFARTEEGSGLRRRPDDVPTRRDLPAAIAFFARVPARTSPSESGTFTALGTHAQCVLAWIDGRRNIDAVVAASAMSTEEALAALEDLRARGIVTLG